MPSALSTVIAALAGTVITLAPCRADEAPAIQDVVFIVLDDQNDWLGCYGNRAQTPHIDRLAARGVRFSNAHCPAPMCNASRAAVLTGTPPHRSGIYNNNDVWPELLPRAVTLPQHLRAHGWRTYSAGKVFHNEYPDPLSWDEPWPSPWAQQPPGAKMPEGAWPLCGQTWQSNARWIDWGVIDAPLDQWSDVRVATQAAAWLAAPATGPRFIAVGIIHPHLPWYVPQEFLDRYPLDAVTLPRDPPDEFADIPQAGKAMAPGSDLDHRRMLKAGGEPLWKSAVRHYLASVSFADHCVGQVLDAVERSGRADRTLIVLWSDNGFHLGEKTHWSKFTLWQRSTQVPLIISGPGVAQGATCDAPVDLMALYPTIAALTGHPAPEGVIGTDLSPWLRDPAAPPGPPALVTYNRGNHAVIDRAWHYIAYAHGDQELYHRQLDAGQHANVADLPEHADVVARLRAAIPPLAQQIKPKRAPYRSIPIAEYRQRYQASRGAAAGVPSQPPPQTTE